MKAMGIDGISRSQVSELAKSLDTMLAAFRTRPRDDGPSIYIWLDALTQNLHEGGRIVNVAAIVATGGERRGTPRDPGYRSHHHRRRGGLTAFLRSLVASWPRDCRGAPRILGVGSRI